MQVTFNYNSQMSSLQMNFPSYPGTYLDAHAVKDIFTWKASKNLGYFTNHMLQLPSSILKMDATFAEAKCIGTNGPAVENRFNVLNEKSQIIAYYPTPSESYSDYVPRLKEVFI